MKPKKTIPFHNILSSRLDRIFVIRSLDKIFTPKERWLTKFNHSIPSRNGQWCYICALLTIPVSKQLNKHS